MRAETRNLFWERRARKSEEKVLGNNRATICDSKEIICKHLFEKKSGGVGEGNRARRVMNGDKIYILREGEKEILRFLQDAAAFKSAG